MDFVEACRQIIGIDSTPSCGNLAAAEFAAKLCQKAGLHVELQHGRHHGVEQANLIARPRAERPAQEFMLQAHLDTADPGSYSLWKMTQSNPFNASIYSSSQGDKIYGLGAADVKLDFLCKLRAIAELGQQKWKLPFVLVGTHSEELGMTGAIQLVRKKKISARHALIGEATEMRLNHAAKGVAGVEIRIPFSEEERAYQIEHNLSESTSTQSKVFSGQAAHSSTPHLGENAILKMLRYLAQLPNGLAVMGLDGGVSFNTVPAYAVLEIDMVGNIRNSIGLRIGEIVRTLDALSEEFGAHRDPGFSPETPTLNIGRVRTLEDCVVMSGDCRWPPCVSDSIYATWMDRLRDSCNKIGASFHLSEYKPPFATRLDSQLLAICREELSRLGLNIKYGKQSSTNEANVFSRLGIDCVVIGPGVSEGNVHTPNEHVKIEQLETAIAFYKQIILRICL